jgi:flagellar biogenesis protein FliO
MNSADELALLGRVMGGLIVVLVVIGLVARIARRRGTAGGAGLRVVDRVGLSREANLAVVEVSNRMLLLGVTAHGVTMLADLDDAGHRDARHLSSTPADHQEPNHQTPGPDTPRHQTPGSPDHQSNHQTPQHQTPEHETPEHETPLPTAVLLADHPDLASALRAAGRTAGSSPADPDVPMPAIAPRSRAEARAQSGSRERGRIPRQRTPTGPSAKRAVADPGTQASGSVLSPRTWRNGIEALRELTVRRG